MRTLRDFNPAALIALGYRTIEIRTTATPPIKIDLLASPESQGDDATMRKLQPAVILEGNLGRVEIAPYGMPLGISPEVRTAAWAIGIGLGASVVGVLLFGGALFGRRS